MFAGCCVGKLGAPPQLHALASNVGTLESLISRALAQVRRTIAQVHGVLPGRCTINEQCALIEVV